MFESFIINFHLSLADIVGFSISSLAAFVAFVACGQMYMLAKIMKGRASLAFMQTSIGIMLTMIAVAFLGLAFGPLNIHDSMFVAIVGPSIWLIANIFLLAGFSWRAKVKGKDFDI